MNARYQQVESWLIQRLTSLTGLSPDAIDVQQPFADYELDSSVAVTLAAELSLLVERKLSPTLFWEYPNIRAVSRQLSADRDG